MLLKVFVLLIPLQLLFCVENSKIDLHFIDVGEGDATLIDFNKKYILIDTGNFISGINLLNYLLSNRINKIDSIILTHPHFDHIGGIFAIMKSIEISNIYDNGENIETFINCDIYRWYNNFFRGDKRYKKLQAGELLNYDKLILEIIWPPAEKIFEDWNANSLVLRLNFGKFGCLFMGDANIQTEKEILKYHKEIKSQILKAGHHGAGDTADIDFIQKVSPPVVIISVNKNNIRGYPFQDTINRYKENGASVYTTAEKGTIIVSGYYNGNYEIKTER